MKIFSRSAAVTGLAVSLVADLGAVSPQAAAAQCTNKAAGTYLTTIMAGENLTSRSTLRLGVDGTVSAVDSAQGTVGFTEAQGTWRCEKKELVATTLDFNTAGDSMVRADYVASFDKKQQTVAGTITLQSFPLTGNPFTDQGTPIGSFTFTSERLL